MVLLFDLLEEPLNVYSRILQSKDGAVQKSGTFKDYSHWDNSRSVHENMFTLEQGFLFRTLNHPNLLISHLIKVQQEVYLNSMPGSV